MPVRLLTAILNWSEVERPCRLLEALEGQGVPAADTLLLDNGSPNHAGEKIRTRFPEIRFLRSEENHGFAGGMNRILRWALEAEYQEVLLLNQDLLPEPGMIEELERILEARPGLAVVGPALSADADPAAPLLGPNRLSPWTLGYSSDPVEGDREYQDAEWISGAAMLLRLRALEGVTGFDEDFFLYWEDLDLCHRLRSAGWEVGVAPRARASHPLAPDGHSPVKTYFMARNRWIFLRKHSRGLRRPLHAGALLARSAKELAAHVWKGRPGALMPCLLGTWDGLRGQVGAGRLEELLDQSRSR